MRTALLLATSIVLMASVYGQEPVPSPRSDLDGSPGLHNFGVFSAAGGQAAARKAEIQAWLAWGIEVGILSNDATTKDARDLRRTCRMSLREARIVEGFCYYTDGVMTVVKDSAPPQ